MYLVKNLPTLTGDEGGKSEKIKQERDQRLFCLLNGSGNRLSKLTTFFVRTIMGLGIGGVVGLVIGGTVLTGTNVAVSFFELSLW